MSFTDQEIEEFKTEARELLDLGEKNLLALDGTADFTHCFDSIFRAFHNLKGASGMMEMVLLQSHTHELETILMKFKEQTSIPKIYVGMFLRGIDGARALLEGKTIEFDFNVEPKSIVDNSTLPLVLEPAQETVSLSLATSEFISECEEIISRFTTGLRQIESGSYDKETVDHLYREMHSLKGAAYLFGYAEMGDVAHAMESALDPMREGISKIDKRLIDGLYAAIEAIELELSSVKNNVKNDKIKTLIPSITQNLASISQVSTLIIEPELKVVAPENSAANLPPAALTSQKESESASIRVPVALLDNLMTLMGEMVLVRNQVLQFANVTEDLNFLNLSQRLNVVTSEIQGEMMKTRMQPIGIVLNKFHRVVRDLSQELKKNINLIIHGADTELDKSLLEAIKDPLTHIVRNSCDHGIETIENRRKSGKSDIGTIVVKSYHEGGQVVIEITDDGKGLHKAALLKRSVEKGIITDTQALQMSDKEIFNLIFAPGLSTAEQITNVSGRGVGMDVVRTNIEKIGGTVDLTSIQGQGTTIRLKIPLTLAIVPALIVHGAQGTFAIPQVKLIELVRVDHSANNRLEYLQDAPVYRLRGSLLPIVELNQVLGRKKQSFQEDTILNIAVLNAESHVFGLIVDQIEDTADIVVKPLSRILKSLHVYAGATVLGDGSIALILDVQGIAKVAQIKNENEQETKSANDNAEVARSLSASEQQDFLLVKLNAEAKHAIILTYVHRLEEFNRNEIIVSGDQRLIRYRDIILPILSANEHLNYGSNKAHENEMMSIVVIARGDHLFGIEVDEILDTLTTTAETDTALATKKGIIGNINTENELVVVIDPYELISSAFPLYNKTPDVVRRPLTASYEAEPSAKESLGPKKILLVEDSVFFRRLVKKTLEDEGYIVTTAGDGLQAMELLKSTETLFDLIVSDIEMPRMNGFDFAAGVRANSHHNKTPLLALSSRRDTKNVARGIQAGFDVYLEKMKPDVLLEAVANLIVTATRRSA